MSVRSRVVLCLCLCLGTSVAAPPQQKKNSVPSQNEKLAKPAQWGEIELRLFKKNHDLVAFHMDTSWIPGEDHKGRFRYKLWALPRIKDQYASPLAQVEILAKEVHDDCHISLVLFDADGFELRRVSPIFSSQVNSEGDITGLLANESVQMDASEYKSFLGGSYNLGWFCDESGASKP
jgi:hypothetical protein